MLYVFLTLLARTDGEKREKLCRNVCSVNSIAFPVDEHAFDETSSHFSGELKHRKQSNKLL